MTALVMDQGKTSSDRLAVPSVGIFLTFGNKLDFTIITE